MFLHENSVWFRVQVLFQFNHSFEDQNVVIYGHNTTSFGSGEAYEEFLRTIKERSQRECSVAVTKGDHILMLSICYGRVGTKKRIVIHVKEVESGG